LIDQEMTALALKALASVEAQAKGDPRKLAAVSAVALAAGDSAKAYSLACEARRLAPNDPQVHAATQAALSGGVPDWHFRIVRDEERNTAWKAAIERAVTPGSTVLDVGAGTGLLGLMAARAGARRVVSCEMNPAVADAATRIVAANGYSGQVTIIPRHSRELTEEEMGGKADLFVSEIIANNVVGERAVETVRDVMRRLVKPDGRVIPASTSARVALAWWDGAARRRLQEVDGFDLSEFNQLEPAPHQVNRGDSGLTLRSEAANLFSFDFQQLRFPAPFTQVDLVAGGGPINGIVQWLRIGLDDEVTYENRPGTAGGTCWACLFHPLAQPIDPPSGAIVSVGGQYTDAELRIWLAEDQPRTALD
jgi:type III protein arginine methyltransferase